MEKLENAIVLLAFTSWTILETAGKCHRAPCLPFGFSKELLKACNAFKKLLNRVEKAR